MAVKVRISRIGRTNRPFFRIVAADSRCKRDGRFLDNLGTYDPIKKELIRIDVAGVQNWKSKGAQFSPTVKRILKTHSKAEDKATSTK